MSPEMITIIGTGCSGLFLGGIAWNKVTSKLDDIAEENGFRREEIKTLRADMDKKIDSHIDDNKDSFDKVSGQLQRQWGWQSAHEKEAADQRLRNQEQFGKLEGRIDVHDGNYRQILEMFKEIKQDIRDLKKGD